MQEKAYLCKSNSFETGMATFKIICNCNANLLIDQEFIAQLSKGKLYKQELPIGTFLIEVVSSVNPEIKLEFIIEFETESQQILKKIDLESIGKEKNNESLKLQFQNDPNISFFRNRAVVKVGGLYGYIDNEFNFVIPPRFHSAEPFIQEFALVEIKNGETSKSAFIDIKGNNVLGSLFDKVLYRSETRLVVINDHYIIIFDIEHNYAHYLECVGDIDEKEPIPVIQNLGMQKKGSFINSKGEFILPCIYDYVSNFSNIGYAEVERFGVRRFINKNGQISILNEIEELGWSDHDVFLLDKSYEWCGPLETSPKNHFLKGSRLITVRKDNKWGVCFLKKESDRIEFHELIPCIYDEPLSDTKYGYIVFRKGYQLCMVNLIGVKYGEGEKKGQYLYGELGKHLFTIDAEELYPIIEVTERDGFINDVYDYEWSSIYSFPRFVIKKRGKYGIIDEYGRQLLPCEYDDIYWQDENKVRKHEFLKELWEDNKCLIAEKNGVNELIDRYGNLMTSMEATEIYFYGFRKKNAIIRPKCDSIHYHLYDLEQRKVSDFAFDTIEYGGYDVDHWGIPHGVNDFIISLNGIFGVVDENSSLFIDCKYDKIERETECGDGIFGYKVYLNGKIGYFDWRGKTIFEVLYDTLYPIGGDIYKPHSWIIGKDGKYTLFYNGFLNDFMYDSITRIKEKHEYATQSSWYSNSFVKVECDKRFGVIDWRGSIILECQYDDILEISRPRNNRIEIVIKKGDINTSIYLDYNLNP